MLLTCQVSPLSKVYAGGEIHAMQYLLLYQLKCRRNASGFPEIMLDIAQFKVHLTLAEEVFPRAWILENMSERGVYELP